jgi:hypothetical protein
VSTFWVGWSSRRRCVWCPSSLVCAHQLHIVRLLPRGAGYSSTPSSSNTLIANLSSRNLAFRHSCLQRWWAAGFTHHCFRLTRTGQLSGLTIGIPPVLNFANLDLKARISEEVFSGKKYISLAITEAFAGSDVAGLQTTAVKTSDGKFWIVNGTKKYVGVFLV